MPFTNEQIREYVLGAREVLDNGEDGRKTQALEEYADQVEVSVRTLRGWMNMPEWDELDEEAQRFFEYYAWALNIGFCSDRGNWDNVGEHVGHLGQEVSCFGENYREIIIPADAPTCRENPNATVECQVKKRPINILNEDWCIRHGIYSNETVCWDEQNEQQYANRTAKFSIADRKKAICEKLVISLKDMILKFVEDPEEGTRATGYDDDLREISQDCQATISAMASSFGWDNHDNIIPAMRMIFDESLLGQCDPLVSNWVACFLRNLKGDDLMSEPVKLAIGYDAILMVCYDLCDDEASFDFFAGKLRCCFEHIRNKYKQSVGIPAGIGRPSKGKMPATPLSAVVSSPTDNLTVYFLTEICKQERVRENTKLFLSIFSKCHHLTYTGNYHENQTPDDNNTIQGKYELLFERLEKALNELKAVCSRGDGIVDEELLKNISSVLIIISEQFEGNQQDFCPVKSGNREAQWGANFQQSVDQICKAFHTTCDELQIEEAEMVELAQNRARVVLLRPLPGPQDSKRVVITREDMKTSLKGLFSVDNDGIPKAEARFFRWQLQSNGTLRTKILQHKTPVSCEEDR